MTNGLRTDKRRRVDLDYSLSASLPITNRVSTHGGEGLAWEATRHDTCASHCACATPREVAVSADERGRLLDHFLARDIEDERARGVRTAVQGQLRRHRAATPTDSPECLGGARILLDRKVEAEGGTVK